MENHQHEVQVRAKDGWLNVAAVGDWHKGSVGCEEKKIDRDIKWLLKLEEPKVIFGMGDFIDAICYRDKRFDPAAIHPRYRNHHGDIFRRQINDVKPLIAQLEPWMVGCHTGNHELACCKYYQYDVHAELMDTFPRIRDLLWSALTKITVNYKKTKLFDFVVNSRHGLGEVRTLHTFQQRTKNIRADIKIAGHNHLLKYEIGSELKHRDEGGDEDVDDERKVWAFTGGYLRTYASGMVGYGEPRGYEPIPLGCLNIKVRRDPDKPDRLEFEAKTT